MSIELGIIEAIVSIVLLVATFVMGWSTATHGKGAEAGEIKTKLTHLCAEQERLRASIEALTLRFDKTMLGYEGRTAALEAAMRTKGD